MTKSKTGNSQVKFVDILLNQHEIDLLYGSNQYYMCENADILFDTINKITNCPFYKFDKYQKKVYYIILDMIKDVNFDYFIDLKRRLFFSTNILNNMETERKSTFRSEGVQTVNNDYKININPYLELIINNLIEDLKIFSIVIAQDEVYFNSLFTKEDLTVTESKYIT
jgi:hypothetical protein